MRSAVAWAIQSESPQEAVSWLLVTGMYADCRGLQKSWTAQIGVNDLVGMAANAGCPQNGVMQGWIIKVCQVAANTAAASSASHPAVR